MKAILSRDGGSLENTIGTRTLAALAVCAFVGCAPNVEALGSVDGQSVNVDSQAVSRPIDGGHPSPPGAPSMFVVDSTNTLYSFDADGNPLQKMQFKAAIGNLNGGITVAMSKVYVTWIRPADSGNGHVGSNDNNNSRNSNGSSSNSSGNNNGNGAGGGVFAFDAVTLKQVRLHIGAFTVSGAAGAPGVLHGIAYDPHNDRFYVATDRLGLLAFDRAGAYIPRTPESTLPVSAVAYDAAHNSLWGIVDRHAVVQFSEQSNAPLPGLPATAVRYRHGRGPLAVAYCTAGGERAGSPDAIAVAFGAAKAGSRGVGAGQTYDTGGKPIGSSYGAKVVNPHAMSCSSRGEVFVAADNGLLEFTLEGAVISSPRYSQNLTAPIYGVFAAY